MRVCASTADSSLPVPTRDVVICGARGVAIYGARGVACGGGVGIERRAEAGGGIGDCTDQPESETEPGDSRTSRRAASSNRSTGLLATTMGPGPGLRFNTDFSVLRRVEIADNNSPQRHLVPDVSSTATARTGVAAGGGGGKVDIERGADAG